MNSNPLVNKSLITIVKGYKCLYDSTSRSTCNLAIREQAWREVAKKLAKAGITLIDPVQCWKALRSNFTRNHKVNNYNWIYYNDLLFLVPFTTHKGNTGVPLNVVYNWTSAVSNINEPSTSNANLANMNDLEEIIIPFHEGDLHMNNVIKVSNEEFFLQQAQEEAAALNPLYGSEEMSQDYLQEDDNILASSGTAYFEDSHSQQTDDISEEDGFLQNASSNAETRCSLIKIASNQDSVQEEKFNDITHLDKDIVPLRCSREKISDGRNFFSQPGPLLSKKRISVTAHDESTLQQYDNKNLTEHTFDSVFGPSNVKKRKEATKKHQTSPGPIIVNKIIPKKVTPELDAFAKKKKIKNKKKSDAESEKAIVQCCEDMKGLSQCARDLISLQKLELEERVAAKRAPLQTVLPVQEIKIGNGFLNLIRKEWNKLTEIEQEDLFFEVLTIMENFTRG